MPYLAIMQRLRPVDTGVASRVNTQVSLPLVD